MSNNCAYCEPNLFHNHKACVHINKNTAAEWMQSMEWDNSLWGAARDGNENKVRTFLSQGVDPNLVDQNGYTPLHYSSRNGNVAITRELLHRRANPNFQAGTLKTTPLHRASAAGRLEVVELLLDCGADPSLQDSDGETALHRAAKEGYLNIVKILSTKFPTIVKIKDKNGKVPYDISGSDTVRNFLMQCQ